MSQPMNAVEEALALLDSGTEESGTRAAEMCREMLAPFNDAVLALLHDRYPHSEPVQLAIDRAGSSGLNKAQIAGRLAVELSHFPSLDEQKFNVLRGLLPRLEYDLGDAPLIEHGTARLDVVMGLVLRAESDHKARKAIRGLWSITGSERPATARLLQMVPFVRPWIERFRPAPSQWYVFRVFGGMATAMREADGAVGFFAAAILLVAISAGALLAIGRSTPASVEGVAPQPVAVEAASSKIPPALDEALTLVLGQKALADKFNESEIIVLPDYDAAPAAEVITQRLPQARVYLFGDGSWGFAPDGTVWFTKADLKVLPSKLTEEKVILVGFEASRLGRQIVFRRLAGGDLVMAAVYVSATTFAKPNAEHYLAKADYSARLGESSLAELFYRMAEVAAESSSERGRVLVDKGAFLHSVRSPDVERCVKAAALLLPQDEFDRLLPAPARQEYRPGPDRQARREGMAQFRPTAPAAAPKPPAADATAAAPWAGPAAK